MIKSRNDLGNYLNDLGLVGRGVEVGCYDGWFASAILQKWKGRKLYLIDAWKPYNDPENTGAEGQLLHFVNAVHEMDRFEDRACIIRDKSVEASWLFQPWSLDFVYIDADHTRDGILHDLNHWYDRVKPGGIISGHDYFNGNRYGFECAVKDMVDDFFYLKKEKVYVIEEMPITENSWIVIKKDN